VPNHQVSLPILSNPPIAGSQIVDVPGQVTPASYNNPRCYKSWVAQVNHANARFRRAIVHASFPMDALSPTSLCEDSGIGLQVLADAEFTTFHTGTQRTGWFEVETVVASGEYVAGGVVPGTRCVLRAEVELPVVDQLQSIYRDYAFRIIGSARDNSGNTLSYTYNLVE
jgi:hypothetical protein